MNAIFPLRLAIIGCGNISSIYFKNLQRFSWLKIVAVSDLKPDLLKTALETVKTARSLSMDEIIQDPEIDLVINLTPPQGHFPLSLKCLEAKKSVYSEKPAALTVEQATQLLHTAEKKNVLFGCAPDTFLGAGAQTCRKIIDDGWIGEPLAFQGAMLGRGPESWHPNPEFFYKPGAGPLFDMGPYYLTTFVHLLGPIQSVISMNKKGFQKRLITSQPKSGSFIDVEVPTHYISTLELKSGVIGSLTTSFDVPGTKSSPIEIYGSEGTLLVPDPNTFGGPIFLKSIKNSDWKEIPFSHPYSENWRGLGIADMALALTHHRPPRASGQLATHVLETIEAIHLASDQKKSISIQTSCTQPKPLFSGLTEALSTEWN